MKLHCWYKPKIPTTSPSLHRPVHWSNSTNCHIRSAICILVNSSFVTSFVGYASILPRRLDGCIGVLNNYERSIRSHDATYLDNCPIMDRWSQFVILVSLRTRHWKQDLNLWMRTAVWKGWTRRRRILDIRFRVCLVIIQLQNIGGGHIQGWDLRRGDFVKILLILSMWPTC